MILIDTLRKLFSDGAVEEVTGRVIDKVEELEEQIKTLQVQAGVKIGAGAERAKSAAQAAYKEATEAGAEAHEMFQDTVSEVSDAVKGDGEDQ